MSFQLEIEFLSDDIMEIPSRVRDKVLPEFLRIGGEYLKSRMILYAPIRTGRLVDSISVEPETTAEGYGFNIVIGAPYASYVVYGTAPHYIYPVNASVLHFQVDGREVFAAYVYHPGTRPNPFVSRSLMDFDADSDAIWRAAWEAEFR